MKQNEITLEQAEQNHGAAMAECRRYADASARCAASFAEKLSDAKAARGTAGEAFANALLDGTEQKPDSKVAKALADALTGAERDREASRRLSAKWAQSAGNEVSQRRALIGSRIQDAIAKQEAATNQAEALRQQLAELERQIKAIQAEAGDGGIIDRLEIEAEHAGLTAARRVRLELVWLDEATARRETYWPHIDELTADPAWPVDRAALTEILDGWRDGMRATDPEHRGAILYPRQIAILWDSDTGALVSVEILAVMDRDGALVNDTSLLTISPERLERRLVSMILEAETRLGVKPDDRIADYVSGVCHPDQHVCA